jgi:hypothetical protein
VFYKAIATWAGILVLAIANGWLREAVLIPKIGRFSGLFISGLLLSLAILVVAYASLPWLDVRSTAGLLAIGLVWLGLTLAFEVGYGHLAQRKSWSELLQAYTFRGGNIWPIVLACTAAAPYLAAKLRLLCE